MAITIKAALGADDWNPGFFGWNCPLLRIPGANIDALYTPALGRIDHSWYEVQPNAEIIRWTRDTTPPKSVSLSVTLTKELETQDLSLRWKKLAIILPLLVSLLIPTLGPTIGRYLPFFGSGRQGRFTSWTVTGKVTLGSLSSVDVIALVRPPAFDVMPNGSFTAEVPIETREQDGHLTAPYLLFFPKVGGYNPATILLNPDQQVSNTGDDYQPISDSARHAIALLKPISFSKADTGYASNDGQVAHLVQAVSR